MITSFEWAGIELSANVKFIDEDEIEITSMSNGDLDATFLLDSSFADQLEMAAKAALIKSAEDFEADCRLSLREDYEY